MLTDTDISQFIWKSGVASPQPLRPLRFNIVYIDHGGDDDKARVVYEGDPQVYDSGKMLAVVYKRNKSEPDAIENQILDSEEPKDFLIMDVLDEVISSISVFYPTVTGITLKTIEGKLTATSTEALDEIVTYLPIPAHLSHVSTVPITDLRKVKFLDMDVDCVEWKGETFAFKKTGEHLEGTLQELVILDRLRNSPNIIDLIAIVVNKDKTIRGFLTPYMHAGDLENVFVKVREDLGVAKDDDKLVFDWSLKLTWARQITQGLVDLHTIKAYNGDVKPQNVVLGPTGQAVLIDFLPMGISDEFAAPEVLAKYENHDGTFDTVLSGPSDVYSLGLVLYALTQEKAHGVRVPLWKDESMPRWYRDVVHMCLNLAPEARPSALEVLTFLQNEGNIHVA